MAARPLAVVTGASSGIGRALALRLACGGHDLALVARDHSRLGEVAKQAEALGARAQTIIEDLSKPGAAQRVAARVEGPVELLVNNAGFGMHGEFWRTVLSQEQAMLQIHVGALLELTRALLPGMVSRGRGRVANIGSVYSYAPMPYQAVYGATKAFLLSFSEALNGELSGTGVTVTAVPPGLTRTESQPRRHRGQGRGMSSAEVEGLPRHHGRAAHRRPACRIRFSSSRRVCAGARSRAHARHQSLLRLNATK